MLKNEIHQVRKRNEIVASSPLVEITLLHRAMRLELEAMCALAERLEAEARRSGGDVGTDVELEGLERRYRDFDVVFSSHSSAEDDFIFPTLATRGSTSSFTTTAAQEHQEEVELMRMVEEAFRLARRREPNSLELLRSRLRVLKERLSEHMLKEEEAIFPLLASFSSDELSHLVGLVLGSRPSEVLEATIRMEVTHLEADHARHVLSTMCGVAAKTSFRDWLNFKFQHARFGALPSRVRDQPALPPVPASLAPAAAPHLEPCPHYGHTTRVVAPCCGALVCCRRCHDARGICPLPMDARAVTTMRCSRCDLDQPLSEACITCRAKSANYMCDVCNLLDDTHAPIYHCPYCNLCRRGFGLGVDHMHCMNCNLCVTIENIRTHPCGADARALAGIDPAECA